MIRIVVFKRSVLFVLLVSSSVSPLLALPSQQSPTLKNKTQISPIFNDIKNVLANKGLDEDAAIKKVDKLFKDKKSISTKLSQLYNNLHISQSKDTIINALAKYALYEKSLDLNSHSSLVGFVQSITLKPLDKNQLAYISSLSSTI